MSRVFISYSRKDSEFALKLANDLRRLQFHVWIDQLDIPVSVPWDDEIEKALDAATHFLLILSTSSVSSPNVKDELALALDENKIIIPVLLEDCRIPLRIRRTQYIDFKGSYEPALTKLAGVLSPSSQIQSASDRITIREAVLHPTFAIEGLTPEDGILTVSANSHPTLTSILNDLYFRYIMHLYPAFTYGQRWILVSQNLPVQRVIGSWDWFVNMAKLPSMHALDRSWDRQEPLRYGMTAGSRWKVFDVIESQIWEGVYAIAFKETHLAASILSGEQGSIAQLIKLNRLEQVSLSTVDEGLYAFQYLLFDESRELGGQIFRLA
jgi:hypothetical protein